VFSISELARRFGLSRSTLLYYDRIGLLKPSGRTVANYRRYSEDDLRTMERIRLYREAGLPLRVIRNLVTGRAGQLASALEARLAQITSEIAGLRRQQAVVVHLLEARAGRRVRDRMMTKNRWVAILRASGLNDADMRRWHVEFERQAPDSHQEFLESLGIDPHEVDRIRAWARSAHERPQA